MATVDRKREILNVAIQEMGHLATVQNILILVGGPDELHLERDVYRTNNPKNPLPFVLEPASKATLAKDVVAEMPATVPAALKAEVDKLISLAKLSAGEELHRVGAIYFVLRWIFLPAARARRLADLTTIVRLPPKPHVVDTDLTPAAEVAKYEARRDTEWQTDVENFILETPHTCAEVVTALDRSRRRARASTKPRSRTSRRSSVWCALSTRGNSLRGRSRRRRRSATATARKAATRSRTLTRVSGARCSACSTRC